MKKDSVNIRVVLVIAGSLIFLLLSIFFRQIPFFWDSVNVSQNAHYYYDHSFGSLLLPKGLDIGHTPLFAMYLAAVWSLLGRTLTVSHLAMLPFAILLVHSTVRLISARKGTGAALAALSLLFCEPTLTSQYIYLSPDFALTSLFLYGLSSLLLKKKTGLFLSLLLLPFFNMRGIPLVLLLLVLQGWMERQSLNPRRLVILLSALLPFILWILYHYSQTGWFLSDPTRAHDRSFADGTQIFRNILYAFWRILDLGKVGLFAILIYLLFFKKISGAENQHNRFLFTSLLIVIVIPLILITNPISNRYFLPLTTVSVLLFAQLLEEVKPRTRNLLFVLTALTLLSGNFWRYPARYGNAWDASWQAVPYFSLQTKSQNVMKHLFITENNVASTFPYMLDSRYSHLSEEGFRCSDKDDKGILEYPWILYTNVSNAFTADDLETLRTRYFVFYSRRQWGTEVVLYKRLGKKN